MATKFSSDGFDLDSIQAQEGDEVVYEIGGGASIVKSEPAAPPKHGDDRNDDPLGQSEEWKRQGNEQFKLGNYLEAYDLYSEAIDACPGQLKGEEILKLRDEFEEKERAKAIERQRQSQDQRREKKEGDKAEPTENDNKPGPPAKFELPRQEYGDKLAIYYCNRAATLQHMERYDDAIKDCTISMLLHPKYTKAFVRRSAAYEKLDDTEDALRDAKQALELEPQNPTIRKSVSRLQKMEDERLEKLKEETLGKLKDLGNSLLGNFGLSLDNFNAVQDPNTGSYSISFNQNG